MIFFGRFPNVGAAAMPLAQAARKLAIANKPATKSIAKARGPTNRDQEVLGSCTQRIHQDRRKSTNR
jgi:hypothetical protein